MSEIIFLHCMQKVLKVLKANVIIIIAFIYIDISLFGRKNFVAVSVLGETKKLQVGSHVLSQMCG